MKSCCPEKNRLKEENRGASGEKYEDDVGESKDVRLDAGKITCASVRKIDWIVEMMEECKKCENTIK